MNTSYGGSRETNQCGVEAAFAAEAPNGNL